MVAKIDPLPETAFLVSVRSFLVVYLGRHKVRRFLAWIGATVFSECRWGRKLAGGRWERWMVASCQAKLWLPVTDFYVRTRTIPDGCIMPDRGFPETEEHPSV